MRQVRKPEASKGCERCAGFGVTYETREGSRYTYSCTACEPGLSFAERRAIFEQYYGEVVETAFC